MQVSSVVTSSCLLLSLWGTNRISQNDASSLKPSTATVTDCTFSWGSLAKKFKEEKLIRSSPVKSIRTRIHQMSESRGCKEQYCFDFLDAFGAFRMSFKFTLTVKYLFMLCINRFVFLKNSYYNNKLDSKKSRMCHFARTNRVVGSFQYTDIGVQTKPRARGWNDKRDWGG